MAPITVIIAVAVRTLNLILTRLDAYMRDLDNICQQFVKGNTDIGCKSTMDNKLFAIEWIRGYRQGELGIGHTREESLYMPKRRALSP